MKYSNFANDDLDLHLQGQLARRWMRPKKIPVIRPCLYLGAFPKMFIGFLTKYFYVTNLFITLKSTFVQFPLLIMFTIPLLEFSVRWIH